MTREDREEDEREAQAAADRARRERTAQESRQRAQRKTEAAQANLTEFERNTERCRVHLAPFRWFTSLTGRIAGRRRSAKKTRAVRENGKRGARWGYLGAPYGRGYKTPRYEL